MKKLVFLLIFALIFLIGLTSFFWLYEVQFKSTRASINPSSFSVDNSYIFVTPLRAKANNQEKIRITIFVLSNQGLGVAGKKVSIPMSPGISSEATQGLTDQYGKAFFDVSSTIKGDFNFDITVDDIPLKQKAHISFY